MNCSSCGLENRPIEATCAHCGLEIQEADAARAKRREWEALPPQLREEQEKHFAALRERFDDHLRWLRRHRWLHAIVAGLVVSIFMNAAVLFEAPQTLPIDFALGAAAGFLLNRWRGGAYRGMWLFAGAGAVSVVALSPFINMKAFWEGWFLISALVLGFVAAAGYYLGLKMEIDHVERQFI
jgi:hypothetical protein